MIMNELIEWLERNAIQYQVVDKECIDINGIGKTFVQDMSQISSIFRKDDEGELMFHCAEDELTLQHEGIENVVFQFGDNWYWHNFKNEFRLNILKYIGERKPTQIDINYINLGVHTPFELLNSSFMPNMWIKKAKYLGQNAIGVCDVNTMAALFILQKECKAAGIKPIFGYSLTFVDIEGNKIDAKVYVQSQKGLRNLLRIQKAIMVDSDEHLIDIAELLNRGEGNIIVFGKYSSQWLVDNPDTIELFLDKFNAAYYQVDLSEYKAERIDIRVLESTKLFFDKVYDTGLVPPILISDCYYLDKDDAQNKIILNKIATGAAHEQSDDQYFKDADEQYALFTQLFDDIKWDVYGLFKECCGRTYQIVEGAEAKFETTRNYMPKYDLTEEEKAKYGTAHNMFCQLLEEGLHNLIPADKQDEYRKQMEYEKYIIESTDNVDYLLVQYDTVNWCKRNGILVGCGRGSAAGSLLLYLLGITQVDPMKFGLIFERFLLPERAGLYQADVTAIDRNETLSDNYVKVTLDNGKEYLIDSNSSVCVENAQGKNEVIYADDLEIGDDLIIDNRDILFNLNNE